MSARSAIEWTESTWNPVTGCTKVSPGCAHCYAETFAERWRGTPGHPYEQGFDLKLWPDRLELPLRWRKPRRVFVNSMSDLFHEDVPDEFIAEVFAVMGSARRHTFQVLTKRPERMRALIRSWKWRKLVARRLAEMPPPRDAWAYIAWSDDDFFDNIWLGVSIENRRFVGRANVLRETPAAVRFISAEPLLGPLVHDDGCYPGCCCDNPWPMGWSDEYVGPQLDLADIDWLIVGGESGPRHRTADPDWVRDLRDTAMRSSTAFFFKQWGGARPKSNGRELDGRTWDEMPSSALERGA